MTPQAAGRRALTAVQCAVTLVVVLAGFGLIAWLSGIAALGDLPWVLAGAFGGSFAVALFKDDARAVRRS